MHNSIYKNMVKNKEHLIFLKQFFYLANEEIHQKTKQENFKNISILCWIFPLWISSYTRRRKTEISKISSVIFLHYHCTYPGSTLWYDNEIDFTVNISGTLPYVSFSKDHINQIQIHILYISIKNCTQTN